MDRRSNPYTPNAGASPPALAGRSEELESFDVLLDRLLNGYTEQSMLLSGLRGVGKTVLLGQFREQALAKAWTTVEQEPRMARLAHEALLDVAPRARWRDRGKRAAAVLTSFSLTVDPHGALTAGLDIDPEVGAADTGDLEADLTRVLVELGHAASEQGSGVVFLLDELQDLGRMELAALIAAVHRTVQLALPVTVVGAGLPQLPRLAVEAKSYAERLFTFPVLGGLGPDAAREALVAPAHHQGVRFTSGCLDRVVDYTEGYPYFLQLFGRELWNAAAQSPITADDVAAVLPMVEAKLDDSFYRVRADRTTETELAYLRAMAELGAAPARASEVARLMHRTVEQLGTTRSRLIAKGLLYTPGYGLAGYTVPQFDRYLKRAFPLHEVPPRGRRGRS
jgi:hypothetical protein